jgi:hypothetical protein
MPDKDRRRGAVQGLQNIYSDNSEFNSLDFIVRMILNNDLATATPVKVVNAYSGGADSPAGRVDVLPLVCQTDAEGNTIEPAILYNLPYSRWQGGTAAIIIDPAPGDIGLAVFAKQDVSNITAGVTAPRQPGSFRQFDMADGFYFGGFLNRPPSVFIELTQDGRVNITAPGEVHVKGDVIADGVSLKRHVHTNGGGIGNSGPPAGG